MRHPFLLAGRFFIATLLAATGLSPSGCGDSATVSEPAELGNLSASTGTLQPPFNPATTNYTVQLSSDVSTTTITATPRIAGDTIRIDNQPTTSQTITLNSPGAEKSVSIVVTDSGATGGSKSYTVRVRRDLEDNSLQALSVSEGTLAPSPFDKDTLNYTVNGVGASVTSITISATKSDQNSIMQIGSVTVPAGTPSGQATIQLGNTGSATPVPIDITRPSGSKKTYNVTINRGPSGNNNLEGLTISPGTLNFNPNTTSYTVNVASNVTGVTVRPTLADTTATMTVNGEAADSGESRPIALNGPGSNTIITILVIAQNSNSKTYSVNVVRQALGGNNSLSALSVSPGTLNPAFGANTLDYTVNVASTVGSVSITPTREDPNATITVNGQTATSGQARSITLNPAGQSTTIRVIVTAQNGNQKTYLVEVFRAAPASNNNLSALSVTPGPLAPAFSANTTSYSVDVGSSVSSVTVTPTLQDTAATMTVNGQATTSGQARTIALRAAGLSTSIPIVVTAPNGSSKTYTITVDRAALGANNNLSALSVTPGSLAPNFAAGTLNYTAGVATDVTSINVSATKADANAVMSGDVTAGTGVATGQATIPLNGAGTSTSVSITVTAPNGVGKTYAITVNRAAPAAPAAPASAPDLITEDDSCSPGIPPDECAPGTSKEDNFTNVTTPRFTVAPPGTGETPNLYVDGAKVKEGFDQGANTLTPTAALSDGDHTVTSTVSNAAGSESPQSPALTVTIDTGAPGTPTP